MTNKSDKNTEQISKSLPIECYGFMLESATYGDCGSIKSFSYKKILNEEDIAGHDGCLAKYERDVSVKSYLISKKDKIYVHQGPKDVLVKKVILPNGEVIAQNEDPNMPNYKKPIYREELREAMMEPIRIALGCSGVAKDPKIDLESLNV